MVADLSDSRRTEPPFLLGERDMREAWLEFHRTALLLKCEGLDDGGRKARPVATSKLSLHGLVRHMGEVERSWFRRRLLSEPDAPRIWLDPEVDDSEHVPLDDADWESDLLTWQQECEHSRAAAARHQLDDTQPTTATPRSGPRVAAGAVSRSRTRYSALAPCLKRLGTRVAHGAQGNGGEPVDVGVAAQGVVARLLEQAAPDHPL